MYSYEIDQFIRDRNNKISNKELFMLTDPLVCPQIQGVEFKPYENRHYLWTNDGYTWGFEVYNVNSK